MENQNKKQDKVNVMNFTETPVSLDENLEELVQHAIQKIDGTKENDICRFLPIPTGGYIHHFTMRKMKQQDPAQLAEMISKYIINVDHPKEVSPKPRAARGSRKERDQYRFSKQDIDLMFQMAKKTGNKEIMRILMPKKDLRTLKRELIASIRHGKVDHELWLAYVETITSSSPNPMQFPNQSVEMPVH